MSLSIYHGSVKNFRALFALLYFAVLYFNFCATLVPEINQKLPEIGQKNGHVVEYLSWLSQKFSRAFCFAVLGLICNKIVKAQLL